MKAYVSACLVSLAASALAAPWDLPKRSNVRLEARDNSTTVDLGYEVHSATVNVSTWFIFAWLFGRLLLPTVSNIP